MQELGKFVVENIWVLVLVISLVANRTWRPVGYIVLTILACVGTISSALLVVMMTIVIIATIVANYRDTESKRKTRNRLNRLIELQTKKCKKKEK